MILKLTILSFLLFVLHSLKIVDHKSDTHFQDDDKEEISIKFKKSDIQDKNEC